MTISSSLNSCVRICTAPRPELLSVLAGNAVTRPPHLSEKQYYQNLSCPCISVVFWNFLEPKDPMFDSRTEGISFSRRCETLMGFGRCAFQYEACEAVSRYRRCR